MYVNFDFARWVTKRTLFANLGLDSFTGFELKGKISSNSSSYAICAVENGFVSLIHTCMMLCEMSA